MGFTYVAAAVCVVAITLPLHAQLPTGSIDGIALDASGARIGGVQIMITNEAQGTTRESQSNPDGSFTFPSLNPGAYGVVLSAPGFGKVR